MSCLSILREEDMFARYEGEELIIALPGTDEEAARTAAGWIWLQVMTHAIEVNGECVGVGITISSGVAQYATPTRTR